MATSSTRRRKRRNPGFDKPVQPDDRLAEVVGAKAQPRSELTKRIWSYIKAHHLQDPDDGRVIRADAKLKPIVGNKRRVSMLELPRHLNAHVH